MSKDIPNGKFLTSKCNLSNTPCTFLKIGYAPYCSVCRVAEEHGKLPNEGPNKQMNVKPSSAKLASSNKSKK